MHKIIYLFLALVTGIIFYSCNSDSPVESTENNPSGYRKLFSVESGNNKFEIWSTSDTCLIYGYNDIGFKVFINGNEKSDGFVNYDPMMIHFPGQTGHSSPRSAQFNYNSTNKMFTGYVCFNMVSDSSGEWTGYYKYNNQYSVDSIPFAVYPSANQVLGWDDVQGGNAYILTLLNPKIPTVGKNPFECLLHMDIGNNLFKEVDVAQMIIKPWMPSHLHGSSGNVNPVSKGNGKYSGEAVFTMSGTWVVYDTIKINNVIITKIPPPKFTFDVY